MSNKPVHHIEKYSLLCGFRCACSTTDLFTVAADRIIRAFTISGATQVISVDIIKAFFSLHTVLIHKLKSC